VRTITSWVLDASAVLAFLNGETGGERVEADLAQSLISAVNLSEVATRLMDRGASEALVREIVGSLGCAVIPIETELAIRAALLRPATRESGLSMGDRMCLALGLQQGLPVLTSDRAFATVDVGVEVELLR
jgi:ribonuclease VapC